MLPYRLPKKLHFSERLAKHFLDFAGKANTADLSQTDAEQSNFEGGIPKKAVILSFDTFKNYTYM